MDLIPAIDIIEGKAVRLSQGDYATKKIYAFDPLELAKQFEDASLTYLHVVDLEGAKGNGIVNLATLERLARNTSLTIDFGGGIKKTEDLESAFSAGAAKITCGSIAVKDPNLVLTWLDRWGPDALILGSDAKDGLIRTSGWLEGSTLEVGPFIDSYLQKGMHTVICTDIAKDGMLEGPSIELYRSLLANRPNLRLIASGGIASLQDLQALQEAGLHGAIIGKAIYEGRISLDALRAFGEKQHAGKKNYTVS